MGKENRGRRLGVEALIKSSNYWPWWCVNSMFSCSWEEPNVQGGLQSPSVLFTPQQRNHRVSTGRGIPALLWMLSSCAAAQNCFWASFADSATLKASPVQWPGMACPSRFWRVAVWPWMCWQWQQITLCPALALWLEAPPEQPCDHTPPVNPSAHRAPQKKKKKVSKIPCISSHCNSLVYPS